MRNGEKEGGGQSRTAKEQKETMKREELRRLTASDKA